MGKVLSGFPNGWAGAISRAVDDIVEAHGNTSGTAIPFGSPVFLDGDHTGVTGITANAGAETFLGFAVRSPAKTPSVYGNEEEGSRASYEADEIVDVLVRGSIVLPASGSGILPGKPASRCTSTWTPAWRSPRPPLPPWRFRTAASAPPGMPTASPRSCWRCGT